MANFIEWLSTELEKREWSQSDLSRRSGISTAQIARLLNGQRNAGKETVTAIARAFKISPDQVFRAAGLLPPTPGEDEWAERMDHKIRLIPPGLRGVAEGLIDSMLAGEEAEAAARPKTKTAKT